MMSKEIQYTFFNRAPRGRATAPRPPHTAAQGIDGERSGANSQLGEHGA